jgi:hypothetical protein
MCDFPPQILIGDFRPPTLPPQARSSSAQPPPRSGRRSEPQLPKLPFATPLVTWHDVGTRREGHSWARAFAMPCHSPLSWRPSHIGWPPRGQAWWRRDPGGWTILPRWGEQEPRGGTRRGEGRQRTPGGSSLGSCSRTCRTRAPRFSFRARADDHRI